MGNRLAGAACSHVVKPSGPFLVDAARAVERLPHERRVHRLDGGQRVCRRPSESRRSRWRIVVLDGEVCVFDRRLVSRVHRLIDLSDEARTAGTLP